MFNKGKIGLYLGSKGLSIVKSDSGKVKNFFYSPYPKDIIGPGNASALKESIFDVFLDNQIETIAFIQKAIRDSRVNDDEIVICIPNRDLIVRFFELPPIPRKEMENTIGMEIKKYIPFKIEEITYDYQIREKQKIIEVLFTGIKNEDLAKYNSLIEQLNLKISVIEPAQFSLLRLLKAQKKISEKESVVFVELDGGDGVVVIVDGGIPCFVRDVKLVSSSEQEIDMESLKFRIINEVRVSLDYYRRQFSRKGVDRIVILSKQETGELINVFSKELGAAVSALAPKDIIAEAKKDEFSIDLVKAFGASLRINKASSYAINLYKAKSVQGVPTQANLLSSLGLNFGKGIPDLSSLSEYLNISKSFIVLGLMVSLLALGGIFFLANSKIVIANQRLDVILKESKTKIADNLANLNTGEIETLKNKAIEKVTICNNVFKQPVFISEKLEVLPKIMPKGVWLTKLVFDRNTRTIYMEGVAYDSDDKQARQLPYDFSTNLKGSALFFNKVQNIALRNVNTTTIGKYKAVVFQMDIILTEDI